MAGLSSAGIGSGLDVNAIVQQLMQVESKPLTTLASKQSSIKSKISAYGQLSSALSSLKTAGTAMNTSSTFTTFKSSFSDTTFGSATSSSTAVAGTYNVNVTQLAKAHTLATAAYVGGSSSTVVGDGSLSITSGSNTFALTIDNTNDTLGGIRDAINNSTSNTSVSASIINDSNGARLVLSAKNSGLSNAISVAVTPSGGTGLNALSYTAGAYTMSQGNAAQDAQLTVNGISIASASNTVSGAITGVDFTLTKDSSSSILTVAKDTAVITKAATDFAAAYSKLYSTVKSMTEYNTTTKTGSLLTGDGTTSMIMTQVRAALSSSPAGLTGAYTSLAQVGIAIQQDGSMTVDSTTLNAAIASNPTDVKSVFNAFGQAVADVATNLTNTNGAVTSRVSGLNSTIRSLDAQKIRIQDRLTRMEANYKRQFSALDATVGSMNVTSNYLSQQISRL